MRLNANGKRLDAWLIYKCIRCGQTWNRPIMQRRPVGQISVADLQAMQQSSPRWVRVHEFDTTGLKEHCAQIRHLPDVAIIREIRGPTPRDWSGIRLRIGCALPTGLRLDRVLCEGWKLPRSQLQRLVKQGIITVRTGAGNPLKRPLDGAASVEVMAAGLGDQMRQKLLAGLSDRPGP
ncbi:MAG: DUF1062 domain-containing protein [Pseudomonadota bacterium]